MAAKSKIEWTDATWNPVTGCTKVSDGCANCYAESMAKRLQAAGAKRYRNGFKVTCHPEALDEPLRWKKPRRIFVCSMGDLFHEDVPDEFIEEVFVKMGIWPRHTYLILTKRPERMLDWFKWYSDNFSEEYGYDPAIWLGVTAENQKTADERIPILLQIPAAVRFVSLEPMLERIGLPLTEFNPDYQPPRFLDEGESYDVSPTRPSDSINWVIIGAESGANRRECKIEDVRDVVGQCKAAGIPAFVKQLHINGKLSKNMAEWPEDLRIREWPE